MGPRRTHRRSQAALIQNEGKWAVNFNAMQELTAMACGNVKEATCYTNGKINLAEERWGKLKEWDCAEGVLEALGYDEDSAMVGHVRAHYLWCRLLSNDERLLSGASLKPWAVEELICHTAQSVPAFTTLGAIWERFVELIEYRGTVRASLISIVCVATEYIYNETCGKVFLSGLEEYYFDDDASAILGGAVSDAPDLRRSVNRYMLAAKLMGDGGLDELTKGLDGDSMESLVNDVARMDGKTFRELYEILLEKM